MRMWLGLAALLAVTIKVMPAPAADLTGTWVLDQDAFRQHVAAAVASLLRTLPPDAVARMRADGVDLAKVVTDAAMTEAGTTIEFLPGGELRVVAADGRERPKLPTRGRWSLEGDVLRLDSADATGMRAEGWVRGDRLELRPVVDLSDPNSEWAGEIVLPLIRRR